MVTTDTDPEPVRMLSLNDAYAIQREAAARRCRLGDSVIGYKIGCVGPAIIAQFGMSGPIRGRLFASERRAPGAGVAAAGYANLAIEGEMAVQIGDDGRITAAHPVIELHDFVFPPGQRTLPALIARNGFNVGVILPAPAHVKPLDDWSAATAMTIHVNGSAIDSGPLWGFAGAAEEALAWLTSSLAEEALSPRPGELILTGTPLGLHPVRPGDRVEIAIDGVVCVTCDITS